MLHPLCEESKRLRFPEACQQTTPAAAYGRPAAQPGPADASAPGSQHPALRRERVRAQPGASAPETQQGGGQHTPAGQVKAESKQSALGLKTLLALTTLAWPRAASTGYKP